VNYNYILAAEAPLPRGQKRHTRQKKKIKAIHITIRDQSWLTSWVRRTRSKSSGWKQRFCSLCSVETRMRLNARMAGRAGEWCRGGAGSARVATCVEADDTTPPSLWHPRLSLLTQLTMLASLTRPEERNTEVSKTPVGRWRHQCHKTSAIRDWRIFWRVRSSASAIGQTFQSII